MNKFRQFVNADLASLVLCSWDAVHSYWICDAVRDRHFQVCVPQMADVLPELLDQGYQETG